MKKKTSALPASYASLPVAEPLLLLDIPEAARMLSTTKWAIRRILWDKKIPFIKIGRKFLIAPDDLRDFIQREKGAE